MKSKERTEKRTETRACDLISRSAVYDRVSRIVSVNHLDPEKVWFTPIGVKALIEEMPPAQPERKVGEWVQVPRFEGDTQPYLECPFCKNKVGWWDLARYCNGCGAKLEGGAG